MYLTEESSTSLKSFLVREGYDVTKALVLNVFPDDEDEVFEILIDGNKILKFELGIHSDNTSVPVTYSSVEQEMVGMNRSGQIKLIVAQDLATCET